MPAASNTQRVFLGAEAPALPAAARWLVRTFADAVPGLGEALVVVPGSRAQRRLTELLAEHSAGRTLSPPTVVTLGGLADRLLPAGPMPVASELESLLAWSSVLREAEPELMQAIAPRAPQRDDWPGWWSLAGQVTQSADELASRLLRIGDVAARVSQGADHERWQALAELDQRYHALLAERGQTDQHAARRDAIASSSCDYAGPIVLIATADLQPVHEQMLALVDAPVYALVFADERDAEGFDALGGLVDSYWTSRALAIDDAVVAFVDRPSDQASAVLSAIDAWAQAEPTGADDITVGLGDAALVGPIARTLDLAGLPVRSAAGRSVGRSRPVLLLRALGLFAHGLRFDKLASLLRHPDAEAYIDRTAGEPTRPWLTLLDRYATDHLAARPAGGWLGDEEQVRAMDAVYRAALALLPEPVGALRPLGQWAGPIADALDAVYGARRLSRFADEDRPVVAALEAIGGVLDRLRRLDESHTPFCTFAQAVTLVADQVAGQTTPEPGGEPAIELVGYLELLLDDAPRLVIAGMNEGHVPEAPRTSALLPEGVRRELGLPDDAHRLARDGYALSAMIASRSHTHVKLIAGRRSLDGDPLLPSRLLLREDDDTLARRVSEFVENQEDSIAGPPMLLTPGKHDRFLIPRPVMLDVPINRLRVTAFRDYLACPYRFYLKHVLRLEALDDRAVELSAGGFGTIAHDALRVLAGDDLRAVDDAGVIAERLSMALDRAFTKAYGSDSPVAARIQAEQVRYRLESFAAVQAELVREGWTITDHEQRLEVNVTVDGEPFTIAGQIDRIDRHADGRWRLIDYKTSDSAKHPDQTHRAVVEGSRVWVDLQLPLYLDLSARLGVDASAELGYINLPKSVGKTAFVQADWTAQELNEARKQRDFVIRQVRAGVFWPPKQPPRFDDGLRGVCADDALNRAALIRAAQAESAGVGDD